MATVLYRLGRLAFRRRGVVLLLWALVLGLAGAGAATLSGPTSSSFSIPGTESQRALDLLSQRTGANADVATARVVFVADDGKTLTGPAAKRAVESTVARLSDLPKVAAVTDPYAVQAVSVDQRTAFATVTYRVKATDLTEGDQDRLLSAGRGARSAGVSVEYGGDAVQEQPGQSATEGIGLLVAALVLVVTFGAFVAAGLPLLTAVAGVGLGVLGIEIVSGFVDLSSTTSTLALMLGLAVGIDYALFIVSRYRHELLRGRRPEEAAGRALGTAGSAVVFAGATVVIALVALSVVGIPFLTQMGLAAAGTVLCAVLIALTLLPAILGFAGLRILGRKGLAARDTEADGGAGTGAAGPRRAPFGERWARGVLRHRVVAVLVTVVGLGIVAVPALDLRLALPSDASAGPDTTQRKAYDALAEGFGPGFNGPLVIVADLSRAGAPQDAARTIATDLGQVRGVVAVTSAAVDPKGTTATYSLIPQSGPTSTATEDLVRTIRADAPAWRAETGASVYVTGTTAVGIDVSQKLSDALLPYLAVVVGLAFVLLALVFRSLLVPLKATVGFLLSVAVAFGAVVAVFQRGWGADLLGVDATGPIISFLPILLVGILFGLAMDYEVFLVTRMREEHVHGASADDAVALGFRHGARVVTAAAIIMVGVFAGFVTSGEAVIASIGFALAVGIFVDAFLVRMTLVPAVMSLLGDRAWWLPRWLDRVLPDLDVEGERLTALLGAAEPAVPAGAQPASVGSGLSVSGVVRRHDGRALAGAVVTLADQSGQQVARTASGPDGAYRLELSHGGTYLLIVAAAHLSPSATLLAVADRPLTRDLTLAGRSAITGRVLARDGAEGAEQAREVYRAVPGALVTLTDVTGEVVGSARSDGAGSYAFEHLMGGSYVLTAQAEHRRPLARTVEVPDSGALAVDLQLTGGGRVTGTVVAATDGRTLAEATVTLVDADGTVVGAVTTGPDGGYAFDDLDGGHYTLTASGYAPVATAVQVDEDAITTLQIPLGTHHGNGVAAHGLDAQRLQWERR